jgi:hypothetical protein
LFPVVADSFGETEGNIRAAARKGPVKGLNHTVEANRSQPFGADMTSISALSSGSYQSPLQKLQAELQTEVNSGAIGSSDQSALSSALTDIDSSLQGGQTGGSPSSPGDLKTRIDNLIAGEVSSGKLTSDQATELKGVFKAAFAHGHGGARGGPPPSDDSSTTDSGSASTSSPSDLLKQLIELLQKAQSASSSSSYDASGSSGSSSTQGSSGSALLIDYKT